MSPAAASDLPYFSRYYPDLRWPKATAGSPGFRGPQLGALHAIGAHFSQHTDRAIVTMPTGSGKTAVLCGSAFLLAAHRVLVITPSRLVREQLADDFRHLSVLKLLQALDTTMPAPRVTVVAGPVTTVAEWRALQNADVVIGTPTSLSPGSHGIPEPPADLFDLVLVDEAHHSPAATWTALLDHFAAAKQILFTATPFRSDQREIKGRFIYTYDLRSAYEDGVYGQLEYLPVVPERGQDPDLAIAQAAERTLRADRAKGLDHLLMVRTAQRTRAKALHELYATRTTLRLALVTGDQSLRHVKATLARLDARELDGLVCVDMLGEGFNLPALKVAALHSPHKSLAVTLQFIGRFARTTAPNLGRAAFHALASDMTVEKEQLYIDGAIWQEIIPSLAASRVEEEQHTQDVLQSFAGQAADFTDVPDLSLYAVRPYFHVKVYNAGVDANVFKDIAMPGGGDVVYRYDSQDHNTVLYIVRSRSRPRWTTASHLDSIEYELFILHLHRDSGYLFICSSRRDDNLYLHFARQFALDGGPVPRGLSSSVLQRVLADLEHLRFFNIGMRNSAASDRDASYVTTAGSAVDQTIEQNDGRRFHRGHYFAKATEGGHDVTIGVSTASKVWSNYSDRLPALIDWCDRVAEKLLRGTAPRTNTGIDHLSFGQSVDVLPPDIIAVDWDRGAYSHPKHVQYVLPDGRTVREQLLDLEFLVERSRTSGNTVGLLLRGADYEYRATFSFDTERLVEPADGSPEPEVIGESTMGLIDYLNERFPTLYTASFAYVVGGDLFEPVSEAPAFDSNRIEVQDWRVLRVDPQNEVGPAGQSGRSIHSWLEEHLVESAAEIVFYDHGSGEIADFVTAEPRESYVLVTLYHCKASGGVSAGARLADVYEVAGQAVKSRNWQNTNRILQLVEERARRTTGASRFAKGDLAGLRAMIAGETLVQLRLQVVIVQPGLSRARLSGPVAAVLAGADEFVFGQRSLRMRVIGSE